jgi:hypothetical protein
LVFVPAVRPPIGQAFADHGQECPFGAVQIVNAHGDAVRIPEVKFGHVAV